MKSPILVTRPGAAGQALCEQLSQHGALATHLPTIAFAPCETAAVQAQLHSMQHCDFLIFTSPEAVRSGMPLLQQHGQKILGEAQAVAIGAGTAKALTAFGVKAIFPAQWQSEGLLAMPIFQHLHGKNIALVKGEGGRELIEETLLARGAQLEKIITYKRLLPSYASEKLEQVFGQRYAALICASFASVENLLQLANFKWHANLMQAPLVVMSDRVKRLSASLGFQTVWVVENATSEAVIALLAEKGII